MNRIRALLTALTLALLTLSTSVAFADKPQAPPPTEAAAAESGAAPAAGEGEGKNMTSFEASEESVSGLGLMVAAYIVVFVLLGLYVISLVSRERKLRNELQDIRTRLESLDERLASRDS